MALTGYGTTTVLLELKSQVMHRLSAEMSLSLGLLSPRCLTAIVALGAPIVCLLSRDMPQGLSIREYIDATLEEDYLCNEQSAVIAHCSLEEQIVHRHALSKMFLKTSASFQDADSLALLQYISNYINMYVSVLIYL
jgi:hydroxymethylpyrimidine pyrophosphatase-like HAD family hydrolase